MFKNVREPKIDETFKFAVIILAFVFLVVIVAISYAITQII